MATKKDLVEAYSFSRRRLITAFVSGAPGGREVEPARPGRTVVGGVALAVLLVAGAAIAGIFSPTAPTDWTDPGLIISTDNGAAYVITEQSDDPELRPVINSTSAKLILGADAATPTMLDQDTIDEQRIGNDIGILGAPASLPTPSLLVDSGWTACTADQRGIRVRISAAPDVTPAPGLGVTVENGGDLYVVVPTATSTAPGAGAYVFPVPEQQTDQGPQTDNLLAAVKLQSESEAVHVSRDWLNLFPTGAPLDWDSFELDGAGQTPTYVDPGSGLVIGDLLETAGGEQLLLTEGGPSALTDFEAAVYRNVVDHDGRLVDPKPVDSPPPASRPRGLLEGSNWPAALPTGPLDEPCAELTAEHDQLPVAQLTQPGELSSGVSVGPDQKDQVIDPGRGAYVLSGEWSDHDRGSPFVIDSKGRANPLVGEQTASLLGYGDFPVVVVPDTWVKLFDCGVNLSQAAALLQPGDADEPSCTRD